MYRLQNEPDKEIIMDNDAGHYPVATLADEYGGRAQICVDDHCYILCLKHEDRYTRTAWWFKEAVEALRQLPANPTDAEIPVLRRVIEEKRQITAPKEWEVMFSGEACAQEDDNVFILNKTDVKYPSNGYYIVQRQRDGSKTTATIEAERLAMESAKSA